MTVPQQHEELGWVMGPGKPCHICGKDYLHEHTHREVVSALAANPNVTQAKSEAVAWAARGKDGKPKFGAGWIFSKVQNDTANMPLYAAPQEAVERQPLTEEQISDGWMESAASRMRESFTDGVLFAEARHGIGPATQEKS